MEARAHIFFIWLCPESPLAPASAAALHPLPAGYARNVAGWGAAYGCAARVYDGAECLSAVEAAAAALSLQALAAEYRSLAARGRWVECVDVARLALLWLAEAGPSPAQPLLYVDTDCEVGPDALDVRRAEPGAPLLVAPQDVEGNVQNCFFAVTAPRHPFLELALRAFVAAGAAEPHPVRASGPALLTALLLAVGPARLPAASAPPGFGSTAGSAPLPPSADECSFPFLSSIPRLAAAVQLVLLGGADAAEVGARRLADTVHLLPPAALFPRHWRGGGTPPEEPLLPPPRIGSAAPQPLFPRLHIPVDLAAFLRPPPAEPPPLAAALDSVDGGKGQPSSSSGGNAAAPLIPPAPVTAAGAARIPRIGTHAWDCTWASSASGGGSGYSAAAAYAYLSQPPPPLAAAAAAGSPADVLATALHRWLAGGVLAAWRAQAAAAAALDGDSDAAATALWDAAVPPLAGVPARHLAQRLRALQEGTARAHTDDAFGTASLAVRVVRGLWSQGVLAPA